MSRLRIQFCIWRRKRSRSTLTTAICHWWAPDEATAAWWGLRLDETGDPGPRIGQSKCGNLIWPTIRIQVWIRDPLQAGTLKQGQMMRRGGHVTRLLLKLASVRIQRPGCRSGAPQTSELHRVQALLPVWFGIRQFFWGGNPAIL